MPGAGRRRAEFQVADALPENEKSAVVAVSSAGVLAWGLYGVLIVLGHLACPPKNPANCRRVRHQKETDK